MEKNDSDLNVPLSKVGETGTKVILMKITSYSPNGGKKWRKKITLAEPIQLGKPIIKEEELKKKGKLRGPCKFFATLSKVEEIKQTSNKEFYVCTVKSDYKIRML